MDRTVGGLGGYVFVKGIPCHALNIVVVLCNLPYQCACSRVVLV